MVLNMFGVWVSRKYSALAGDSAVSPRAQGRGGSEYEKQKRATRSTLRALWATLEPESVVRVVELSLIPTLTDLRIMPVVLHNSHKPKVTRIICGMSVHARVTGRRRSGNSSV